MGEYKVTPNGKYPARGLSINADPLHPTVASRGANKILYLPNELQAIHTPSSNNSGHFDIIPKDLSISESEFQALLNQIK